MNPTDNEQLETLIAMETNREPEIDWEAEEERREERERYRD